MNGFLLAAAMAGATPGVLIDEKELIAKLIEALDDESVEVRQNIAVALANLGESAVPALIDALRHERSERQMGAAIALGKMRPAPRQAVPALLIALRDGDEPVRKQVSYALSRIVGRDVPVETPGPRPKVPPLDPTPGGAR